MVPEMVEPSFNFRSSARAARGASSAASTKVEVTAHTGNNNPAVPRNEISRFMQSSMGLRYLAGKRLGCGIAGLVSISASGEDGKTSGEIWVENLGDISRAPISST